MQTFDQEEDLYDDDQVRHAETPELAREALIDSAVLIYKSQIEVAFREQTAGHNALLLFVGLALQLMEEQLYNAFKELDAKEAEVSSTLQLPNAFDSGLQNPMQAFYRVGIFGFHYVLEWPAQRFSREWTTIFRSSVKL